MQKPDSLRAAIVAALPCLADDADRLKLWVDTGRVRSPMTAARAFAWEYTLTVVITDLTDHPSIAFLAINDWLRVNQPDILRAGAGSGYTFTADIIDNETVDLGIEIELTEQVVLVPRDGGGHDLEHLAEPAPLFDDETPIGETLAPLANIWVGGEQIMP